VSLIGVQQRPFDVHGHGPAIIDVESTSTPIHAGVRVDLVLALASDAVAVTRIAHSGSHLVVLLAPG
jgi:hypothetical protein